MTIAGCLFLSSCTLHAQDQKHEPLSGTRRQISLSASWPQSVQRAVASDLESAPIGRSVLYVKVARPQSEQDVRARVKIFVAGVDEQTGTRTGENVYLGGFSLFPAASEQASQPMDTATFAFNLESYLESLSGDQKRQTILNDLQLTLELVPFESDADIEPGQINILGATIEWKTD